MFVYSVSDSFLCHKFELLIVTEELQGEVWLACVTASQLCSNFKVVDESVGQLRLDPILERERSNEISMLVCY